jgi:hypothetical protein
MRGVFIFFLLWISHAVSGQHLVEGIVYDKLDNSPLPGTNVVEKGTRNGVVSSIDGKFSISVQDENAILVFSGVGYIAKEVLIKGQSNLVVNIKSDCNIDFFDYNSLIYISSGVVNTPLGGELQLTFPVPGVLVVPAFNYQTNLEDNYFMNTSLSFKHLIVTCDFDIDIKTNIRSLSYNNALDAETFSIEVYGNRFYHIFRNSSGIILGFGRMNMEHREQMSYQISSGGIVGISTQTGRPLYLDIFCKVGIYKDVIEYQGEISRYLRPVYLFTRFYKLEEFTELSIGVGKLLYFGTNGPKKSKQKSSATSSAN